MQKKRACNVYVFRLSFHFAYHRCWLGRSDRPLRIHQEKRERLLLAVARRSGMPTWVGGGPYLFPPPPPPPPHFFFATASERRKESEGGGGKRVPERIPRDQKEEGHRCAQGGTANSPDVRSMYYCLHTK